MLCKRLETGIVVSSSLVFGNSILKVSIRRNALTIVAATSQLEETATILFVSRNSYSLLHLDGCCFLFFDFFDGQASDVGYIS